MTTRIEWCDETFNPWIGCTKVSPGCDHCYAERDFDIRKGVAKWGAGNPRHRTSYQNWRLPRRWQKQAAAFLAEHGRRRRVFCASLADVFDNEVDLAWRVDLFQLIYGTPDLDWLLLTKRIGNVRQMVWDATLIDRLPANVWLGATVVNQGEADRDVPKLLDTPAAVRFLSVEPMLGRVDLCEHLGMWWNQTMHCFEGTGMEINRRPDGRPGIGWVIAGGESGPHARPAHPDWFRSLRDQCAAAEVPFFFKQWGEWVPDRQLPSDERARITDKHKCFWINEPPMVRVGKKRAGRLLDGVEHREFPQCP